jgi:hypothetical protein
MSSMKDHIVTNAQLAEVCESEGRSKNFSSQLTTMKNNKLIKSVSKGTWQMTSEGLKTLKQDGDQE